MNAFPFLILLKTYKVCRPDMQRCKPYRFKYARCPEVCNFGLNMFSVVCNYDDKL